MILPGTWIQMLINKPSLQDFSCVMTLEWWWKLVWVSKSPLELRPCCSMQLSPWQQHFGSVCLARYLDARARQSCFWLQDSCRQLADSDTLDVNLPRQFPLPQAYNTHRWAAPQGEIDSHTNSSFHKHLDIENKAAAPLLLHVYRLKCQFEFTF